MTFQHMHHAMANKALMIEGCETSDYWTVNKARLREIVLSGAADIKSRWQPVAITGEDRDLVLQYLGA